MKKHKIRATFKYGKLLTSFEFTLLLSLGLIMTVGFPLAAIFMFEENPSAKVLFVLVAVLVGVLFTIEIVKHCKH